MSRITYNRRLEREAIKFICAGKPSSKKLMTLVDQSYFNSPLNKIVYNRIRKLMKKNGEIVSWRSLLTDSALPDAARAALGDYKQKVIINKKKGSELYDQLSSYRKRFLVYELTKYANEKQLAGGYDEDALVEELANKVTQIRSKKEEETPLIFGVGSNYKKIVEEIKTGKALRTIKTGIAQWDDVNGGIASKSVTLITGYTGSMKSTLADILSCNFADSGARVGQISYEMSQQEITIMRMARLSRIDRTEIMQAKNITTKQWAKIDEKLDKQNKRWKKLGAVISTHTPKQLGKDDIWIFLEPFQYDIVLIDYVSLVGGIMDSDNFWKNLMNFTAASKVFANNNNCRVILLAQSDEEGKLKLSKNMQNDADLVFTIKHDPANSDVMEVQNPKARKQKPMTLYLRREGDFANICEIPENERVALVKAKVKNDFKSDGPIRVKGSGKPTKTQEEYDVEEFLGNDVDID